MDLKHLPPHGGLLVFGKSRLKSQKLTQTLNSDSIKTPNFFFLRTNKIKHISCGDQHALFASDRRTYAFGLNDWGQLSLKPEIKQEVDKPILVKQLKNYQVHGLASGRSHSLILCSESPADPVINNKVSPNVVKERTLYAFGNNTEPQLGIAGSPSTPTPLNVSNKRKNIVKIASGSDFSIILTSEGVLYGFGDNEVGQLGDKTLEKEV